MHRPLAFALPLAFAVALPACLASRAPAERLVDAAYDHNVAMRFGRVDVALDYVASASRDDWSKRHAAWGGRVRVVDLELSDMKMQKMDEAEVRVQVAWQRLDEADLRTTLLTQTWRDERGGWRLGTETCVGGDKSLLDQAEKDSSELATERADSRAP